LQQLVNAQCALGISTKSKLILRDIALLKQCPDLKVSMSLNTLDENFRSDMDNASSLIERLCTLQALHNEGIYTVLFMSPIFPYITDFKNIIEKTQSYIDEYWFENLNLRGTYKLTILNYINAKYPNLYSEYEKIYNNGDKTYWTSLSGEIASYCQQNNIKHVNYFYHKELVQEKLNKR
jgi:DNA repair photolyase